MTTDPGALTPAEQFAAAAVALMLSLPFVLPFAYLPIGSFFQEWLAAALGGVAFVALGLSARTASLNLPAVAVLPGALIVLLIAQALSGRLLFAQYAIIGALYLCWACLLLVVGARLRERLGLERFAALCAWALAAGAVLSALIGGMQFFGWSPGPGWILPLQEARLYGNLGQPNQFTDYLCVGAASTIFLLASGRMPQLAGALILLLIVTAVGFSGSRAVALYLGLILVGSAALCWRRPSPEASRALGWAAVCVAVFFAVQLLAQQVTLPAGGTADPVIGRLQPDGGVLDTRVRKWHAAILMAREHPWLGVGFKGYAWQHFLLAPKLVADIEPLATDQAHNLFFQVLAEFGLPGAMALLAAGMFWLRALWRTPPTPALAWLCGVVGIVLVHSALEYPLWYAYFLGLACVLVGASAGVGWRITGARPVRTITVACALALGVALAMLWTDYRGLQRLADASKPGNAGVSDLQARILSAYRTTLFPDVVVFALARNEPIDPVNLQAKLAINETAMRVLPTQPLVYRQALLLSLAGRAQAARQAWDRAYSAYPQTAPQAMREMEADGRAAFAGLLEYARSKIGEKN